MPTDTSTGPGTAVAPLLDEGLSVRVVEAPERYAELLASAASGRSHHQRLVASVFTTDQAGLLERALRVLSNEDNRFTIEGSVAAASYGAASMSFALKKTAADGTVVDDLPEDQFQEAKQRLADSLTEAFKLPATVVVEELVESPHSAGLFAGRHLGEVRFGVPDVDNRDWEAECGEMVAHASKLLSEADVPIAYIFGPFRWRKGPDLSPVLGDGVRWVRIGYGLAGTWADDVIVAALLQKLAQEKRWHFGVYDASKKNSGKSMADRFLIDSNQSAAVSTSSTPERPLTPLPLTQGILDAEVGLVSRIVSGPGGTAPRIAGISMAALVGKTMIALVGDGPFHGLPGTDRVASTYRPEDHLNRDNIWVAWRCREGPGIALKVVEAVRNYLTTVGCNAPIEYYVSRVLADGETCAGKLRLTGARGHISGNTRLVFDELRDSVAGVLAEHKVGWYPPYQEWADQPVSVTDREPSEEPWATLALRAGVA